MTTKCNYFRDLFLLFVLIFGVSIYDIEIENIDNSCIISKDSLLINYKNTNKYELKKILKKAHQNDAISQYLLGNYYAKIGQTDKALFWYEKSASKNICQAYNNIGAIYYDNGDTIFNNTLAYQNFVLSIKNGCNYWAKLNILKLHVRRKNIEKDYLISLKLIVSSLYYFYLKEFYHINNTIKYL